MVTIHCKACDYWARNSRQPSLFNSKESSASCRSRRTLLFATNTDYEALNSKCTITNLPVEVLSKILDQAITYTPWSHGYPTYFQLSVISLVCSAFHAFAEHQRFSRIYLVKQNMADDDTEHSLAPACSRVRNLQTLIATDPGLGQICQSLTINLPLPKITEGISQTLEPKDFKLATDLLWSLPNIRKIKIHNGFGQQHSVPFLKLALCGKQHLKHLTFMSNWMHGRLESHQALEDIWECIEGLDLDSLRVHSAQPKAGFTIWKIPEGFANTFRVTRIELANYGETPQTLKTFFSLLHPNTLGKFDISITTEVRSSGVWSLQLIQDIIRNQSGSLKHLAISTMSANNAPSTLVGLSFQGFEVLEILSLSRWDLKSEVTPMVACDTILAPKLSEFTWDFTDVEREVLGAFKISQKKWLLNLARLAIDRRPMLKKIMIMYNPTAYWDREDPTQKPGKWWPWDLIDDVARAVKEEIEVVYSEHVSKESVVRLLSTYEEVLAVGYEYGDSGGFEDDVTETGDSGDDDGDDGDDENDEEDEENNDYATYYGSYDDHYYEYGDVYAYDLYT